VILQVCDVLLVGHLFAALDHQQLSILPAHKCSDYWPPGPHCSSRGLCTSYCSLCTTTAGLKGAKHVSSSSDTAACQQQQQQQ